MSILKYKYKAHKFVNYAFYLVVFIVGFLLGFTTNKIDFNKLINQVLMIDNVNALVLYEDENVTIDEDYIYKKYIEIFPDFNYETNNNILCDIHSNTGDMSGVSLHCGAYSDDLSITLIGEYSYGYASFRAQATSVYHFSLRFSDLMLWNVGISTSNTFNVGKGSGTGEPANNNGDGRAYANFELISNPSTTYGKYVQKLDFNKYKDINYWLNDGSIFKDENHQDFKEICWENFDELMFSVTIDSNYDGSSNIYQEGQQDGETYVKNGFYVFDDVRKLKRGTRIHSLINDDYKYDASTWLGGATFNHLHNITSDFYLMDTEEKIGIRYSDPTMALGNYDIYRGDSYYYDNLNKLLNATYVDFTYYYNVLNDFRYDIFYLEDKKEKFCIYIPNQFVVTTLSINELGGFIGDIPTHNGKNDSFIDVTVTTGQLHFNQLFTIINNFISSIRNTVIFINNFIYSFFVSLHPLIQMFIFTIISLLVVKLIIGMVVK